MKRIDEAMGGWFWGTVKDPALWVTLAISGFVAFLGDEEGLRSAAPTIGAAQAQVGTALLGVVVAALAIIVVFLDEEYVMLLESLPPGVEADLWPFKWTGLVAVFSAVFGVLLILVGGVKNVSALRVVFLFALWSFFYLLWILWDLVRFITMHTRARISYRKSRKPSQKDQ